MKRELGFIYEERGAVRFGWVIQGEGIGMTGWAGGVELEEALWTPLLPGKRFFSAFGIQL